MTPRDLSKAQWDAALEAARVLRQCNPNNAADRQRYRDARLHLVELLPEGTDERSLITEAIHWDAMNSLASALAGLPQGVVSGVEA